MTINKVIFKDGKCTFAHDTTADTVPAVLNDGLKEFNDAIEMRRTAKITKSLIDDYLLAFHDEYKEKIKENDVFERGFLFAFYEIKNRLDKLFEEKL